MVIIPDIKREREREEKGGRERTKAFFSNWS